MKTKFSKSWKSSKQPRKQVKYRANAPLHIKGRFLNIMLSKELKKKFGKNSVRVRKGDKVRILRGQFKKKEGKVERVSVKHCKVYVTGIEIIKKEGSKSLYALEPSNLMIIELNLDDKKRSAKLTQNQNTKTTKENKDTKKDSNNTKNGSKAEAKDSTRKEKRKEERSEKK